MIVAITRKISASIEHCELTHLERTTIDLALARAQHDRYERALTELGCRLISLPEDPGLPDSVFVEDTALVLDELAVITRPGAASRRPEAAAVATALAPHRSLRTLAAPATLDGGDILTLGRIVYVGIGGRSNRAALEQLAEWLGPHGYSVRAVSVTGCLHLKSAVTRVAEDLLLVNPAWVDARNFTGMRSLEIDPSEPGAANALLIGGTVIFPVEHPATLARLEAHGIRIRPVEASEVARAEGAVTCCSLVFESR